jgi:hypothetical protein
MEKTPCNKMASQATITVEETQIEFGRKSFSDFHGNENLRKILTYFPFFFSAKILISFCENFKFF